MAADHLLFVRTRFFSEQYTRLYWNDIQALLLYRIVQNTGLMLGAEIACLLAAVIVTMVQKRFEVTVVALCYVAFYAAWRLTRRNYGVQILTRTANIRIPLTIFRASARRLIGELQPAVEGVQGRLSSVVEVPVTAAPVIDVGPGESAGAEPAPASSMPVTITLAGRKGPRRPTLVLHGIVFGLGLTTWLFASGGPLSDPYWLAIGTWLALLFYAGLIAMFFLQQDPAFPFAVRSAAVMNLALQGAVVGPILALGARLSFLSVNAAMVTLGPPVTLLRLLACLFGLMSIYKNSLDESDKPLAQPGTGSNPLA